MSLFSSHRPILTALLLYVTLSLLTVVQFGEASVQGDHDATEEELRRWLCSSSGHDDDEGEEDGDGYDDDDYDEDDASSDPPSFFPVRLTFTNMAYQQPISPFFFMVHNANAEPIFTLGQKASSALQLLAEQGDPSHLDEYYSFNGTTGIHKALTIGNPNNAGVPVTFPGQSFHADINVSSAYPFVSLVAMIGNTNDAFVGFSSWNLKEALAELKDKSSLMVVTAPAYDAGTEENNESCKSVPGPACKGLGLESTGNGEGFVHVHRGIHGIGDLDAATYDWRNPVLHFSVSLL